MAEHAGCKGQGEEKIEKKAGQMHGKTPFHRNVPPQENNGQYTGSVKEEIPKALHAKDKNLLSNESGQPVKGKEHIGNPAQRLGGLVKDDRVGEPLKEDVVEDKV